MKTDKIIYDIREGVRAITDDSEISDRYILHLVNINRAELIRQLLNSFQRITPATVNQSFCLEFTEVSASDCGLSNCETILRSTQKIPTPLELHNKSAITSIRPTKKLANPLLFTTKERALFSQHSPFKNTIVAYIEDGYVYVVGKNTIHKLIECLTVTGIFEDPLELVNYKDCCNCEDNTKKCFDIETMDYPIPAHIIKPVREMVIQQLTATMRIPSDNTNNSDEQ